MRVIDPNHSEWWRTAVIYQVYPRSFADSNGDGTGDLAGITRRLSHIADLGVDAVWLSPFYPSPQLDGGYDVADYREVDPMYGTLADFDELVDQAHALGLRIIVDLVPNHCSWEHALFKAALAAAPGSPERARFHFADGTGPAGSLPPTDWQSMFGGPAWTRITEEDGSPGQWYLHLFDPGQPDWNWNNPQVQAEFDQTLRFWLDREVDGFRVDVCDAMVKAPGLPSWPYPVHGVVEPIDGRMPPMWDQEGIHDIFRHWRRILDSYEGTRILCAEAWLPPERTARIVRGDEMHQAFNFAYLSLPWDATRIRATITESIAANQTVGAPTTWVLSNHDVMRHASRFGYDGSVDLEAGVGVDDPQPNRDLGLRRARAATALMLALPGSAYLYQGEELGLPEGTALPDDVRQDPVWERSGHTIRGRDGCRIPLPWSADDVAFGFSSSAETWLPQPADFGGYAVDVQQSDPDSTLSFYRSALELRWRHSVPRAELSWEVAAIAGAAADDVLAFRVGTVTVIANLSASSVEVPTGEIILRSEPDAVIGGMLAPDAVVWIV